YAPRLEREVRARFPAASGALGKLKRRVRRTDTSSLDSFLDSLHRADLVIAAGGGYIADAFSTHALAVLDILATARRCGTPTAMLGQGLGPIQNRELRSRVRQVLPGVGLIGLREGRAGLPLLESLDV